MSLTEINGAPKTENIDCVDIQTMQAKEILGHLQLEHTDLEVRRGVLAHPVEGVQGVVVMEEFDQLGALAALIEETEANIIVEAEPLPHAALLEKSPKIAGKLVGDFVLSECGVSEPKPVELRSVGFSPEVAAQIGMALENEIQLKLAA